MNPFMQIQAINHNPIGGWSRELCEYYFSMIQLKNTRRDLLNLAMYN